MQCFIKILWAPLLGGFEITEQRLCDQGRAIRKNQWLSEVELENIWKDISNGTQGKHDMEDGATNEDKMPQD